MKWFFSKQSDPAEPDFNQVEFVDKDGTVFRYKPVKNITANEVARLLPLFLNPNATASDSIAYIKKEKLERNFAINPEV
jgi:hypothetical protein